MLPAPLRLKADHNFLPPQMLSKGRSRKLFMKNPRIDGFIVGEQK
jgi:hypothetical protein